MENFTIAKEGYESLHKPENSTVMVKDFFEGVFSYESLTPTTVIIYVFGLLIGVLGPWSIIWYERNCSNRFRTILNQMFARASWYVIVNTIFVMIPEGIRFFYGPYGKTFCDLLFFLKNILWSGILLTLDTILILRYIFIFTKKNFAVINDDVLARIFNLSVLFVATWASVVKRFTPGQLPINYYLCCGKDANEGSDENRTDESLLLLLLLFLLLLLLLFLLPRVRFAPSSSLRGRPVRDGAQVQPVQARSMFRWKWKKKRTRRLQKKRRKMRQRSK